MQHWARILADLEQRISLPDRSPGLGRMQKAMRRVGIDVGVLNSVTEGDLQRIIVVAGTNGKGSTSATLAHLLKNVGFRVGLFISPHLVEVRERIQINGEMLSKAVFSDAFMYLRKQTEDLKLSHFEILTLLAAWIFFANKHTAPVNYAVLEVGMGGLWDATNAIPHGTSVITRVGRDHEALLGPNITDIARNKLGIVPPASRWMTEGPLVVHAKFPPSVSRVKNEFQEALGGRWVETVPYHFRADIQGERPKFFIDSPWGEAELNLAGPRGAENTALALTAFSELGFDPEPVLRVLKHVIWPGRMERVEVKGARCPVYLSGDHNHQGIESLLMLLPYYPKRRLHLLVAVAKERLPEDILLPLFDLKDTNIYLTEAPFKPTRLESIRPWILKVTDAWSDYREAFEKVLMKAQKDDMIVVTGSLYLVGAIKGLIAHD